MLNINIEDKYTEHFLWVRQQIEEFIDRGVTFIDVNEKGGRYAGKTHFAFDRMIEKSIKDPSMSSTVIAMQLNHHQTRTIPLIQKKLKSWGVEQEWKLKDPSKEPYFVREVNGYRQEIRLTSLNNTETAGFEPPINEVTGKEGYFGFIIADEMSKKQDDLPDADFANVHRVLDAIATVKNTFVRFIADEHKGKTIETHKLLNPWGERNPVMVEFHKVLSDNLQKLKTEGYNFGYKENGKEVIICSTTNYLVNDKLSKDAVESVEVNIDKPRASTIVWGATGRTLNSYFGEELTLLEELNFGDNIPSDVDFLPLGFGMDVGTKSPSAVYLMGVDKRTIVKGVDSYYPTRLVVKSEIYLESNDGRTSEKRYKDTLIKIHEMAKRFPELRKGSKLFVDGSALDTIELLKAYAIQLGETINGFDLSWLQVVPQNKKWRRTEKRKQRHIDFADIVGSYGLAIDKYECPKFFEETSKIVNERTEQLYDHCYDAMWYILMEYKHDVMNGIKIKAMKNKPTIHNKTE